MAQSMPHENFLTSDNAVTVISCTSDSSDARGNVANILNNNQKALWIIKQQLPQQCVLAFSRNSKKPAYFNTIGFYCWHQYDSNPALIEISIKGPTQKWQILTKVRMTQTDGWQFFKVEEISAQKIKEVKVRIIQNFGDPKKTYLNQIGFYQVNPSTSRAQSSEIMDKKYIPPLPREKTHSQFLKLTSTERQLKKANERISKLTEEQEIMKKKLESQETIILKMQQTLKRVLISMQKLQTVEEASKYSGSKNTSHGKNSGKKREHVKKVQIGEIDEVLNTLDQIDRQYKSNKKGYPINTGTKRFATNNIREQDTIKMNSEDDDLSEYSQSHYRTYGSQKKNKMTQEAMKQKLKYLLALRNLKSSKLHPTDHKASHHNRSSDDSSCHSDGCPAHGAYGKY